MTARRGGARSKRTRRAPASSSQQRGSTLATVLHNLLSRAKRVLIGRPMRTDAMGHQLLPKRIALPVFASDALSSVAYAPDEILLTLALSGSLAALQSIWVGVLVALVLAVVVLSYRQTVHAYPSGGGDYEVVTTNLGPRGRLRAAG